MLACGLCWIVNCVRYTLIVLLLAPCCSRLQDEVAFPLKWVRSVGVVEGKCQCSHSQKIFFILTIRYFYPTFLFVLSLIKQKPKKPYQYKILPFVLSVLSKYVKYDDDNQFENRAEVRWNLSRPISLLAPSFLFVLLWNVPDPWLLARQSLLFWAFCLLCWVNSTWWVLLAHRGLQQALELGQSQLWKVVKKTGNPAEIKITFFYRTNEKLQAKYIVTLE